MSGSGAGSGGDFTRFMLGIAFDGNICALFADGNGSRSLIEIGGTNVAFYPTDSSYVEFANPIATETWAHYVVSCKNNTASIYVNGQLLGSGDATGHYVNYFKGF